jgi:hypothetical protein
MNNESFDLMHQKTPKMISHWQPTVSNNLQPKQIFYDKAIASSGLEVIRCNCCDEELRERYRM